MEATTDLWDIPAESATRVGHPAPFPVELPQRLIELYTYEGDLVLDPFMGSGTTAVAAVRTRRHFVGYDTDPSYVAMAKVRVKEERERIALQTSTDRVFLPAIPMDDEEPAPGFQTRAVREGQKAQEIARAVLLDCGFEDLEEDCRIGSGVEVNFSARDRAGGKWYFDVSGAFTSARGTPSDRHRLEGAREGVDREARERRQGASPHPLDDEPPSAWECGKPGVTQGSRKRHLGRARTSRRTQPGTPSRVRGRWRSETHRRNACLDGCTSWPEMSTRAARVSYAVLHTDPPDVFIAEDAETLTRLLALEVVARTPPSQVATAAGLELIRSALLEERWTDAVVEWIEHTGTAIDAYPDEPVWTEGQLDDDRLALEIRVAAVFQD